MNTCVLRSIHHHLPPTLVSCIYGIDDNGGNGRLTSGDIDANGPIGAVGGAAAAADGGGSGGSVSGSGGGGGGIGGEGGAVPLGEGLDGVGEGAGDGGAARANAIPFVKAQFFEWALFVFGDRVK